MTIYHPARLPKSKRQHRRALAALPTGETLRLPDGLHESPSTASSLTLRKEPAVYGAKEP